MMGYQRGDYRSGDYNEGRDRDRERNRFERERGYAGDYRGRSDYDDDRGFFDRAGDEVRSWFGDEEAERRRDEDRRRYEDETGDYRGLDYRGERWRERGQDRDWQRRQGERGFGRTTAAGTAAAFGAARGGREQDPHYSEWRRRQIDALDRDYYEYRREHQSKFEQEFGGWREKRRGQRELLNRVTEHMEVLGSDGQHIGTVDKVRSDRIILTRSDPSAGGHHHSIPCGWVDQVEDTVTINKSADEARNAWRDEETNRALFERDDDQRDDGPHVLGRSFSGTYRE